jgi:hypothetical protein
MMAGRRHRQGFLIVLAAVLLTVAAPSSAARWSRQPPGAEILTSAHPNGADNDVSDTATRIGNVWSRKFQAEAAALGSATCTGCHGEAATLHVVYGRTLRKVTLDNVATAWAQCTSCRATAVSVQVVIARHAHTVTANNRALAVDAACTACHVQAAAFQLVVVDPDMKRLSRAEIHSLQQWMRDQVATSSSGARLAAREGPGSLEHLVNDALDSRTVLFDADRG